jgi:hypothetical protein
LMHFFLYVVSRVWYSKMQLSEVLMYAERASDIR